MRPTGGTGPLAQVCHGETVSAAYADIYTVPEGETATPDHSVSTRCAAGALNVLPSGCVTEYPTALRLDASNDGKMATGLLQLDPPLTDLLNTATEWHPVFVPLGQ